MERRSFFSALGAGVALATATAAEAAPSAGQAATGASGASNADRLKPLHEVLGAGCSFQTNHGIYRVVDVSPAHLGAHVINLSGPDGDSFAVEVCAKDSGLGVARGPASTERFDLYVPNGGQGDKQTIEWHGLAVMSLAQVLANVEQGVDTAGLLTLRERLSQHGANVCSPVQ